MLHMGFKSLKKPKKAQSPKRPKARKPQSSKAWVLTIKPDPKAQEPNPARPNTNSQLQTMCENAFLPSLLKSYGSHPQ